MRGVPLSSPKQKTLQASFNSSKVSYQTKTSGLSGLFENCNNKGNAAAKAYPPRRDTDPLFPLCLMTSCWRSNVTLIRSKLLFTTAQTTSTHCFPHIMAIFVHDQDVHP